MFLIFHTISACQIPFFLNETKISKYTINSVIPVKQTNKSNSPLHIQKPIACDCTTKTINKKNVLSCD